MRTVIHTATGKQVTSLVNFKEEKQKEQQSFNSLADAINQALHDAVVKKIKEKMVKK